MVQYFNMEGNVLQAVEQLDQGCWINITPPFNGDELGVLSRKLDVQLDFFTDSLDIDERSRYDREEDASLILINSPVLHEQIRENEAIYITIPIGIILTSEKMITISQKENPIIKKFIDGKVKNMNIKDFKLFSLQIFEQNVLSFLDCLKKLNLKRNLIEQELYNSSRNEELRQLLRIEKSLVYFVNSLSANDLLMMKMKRTDFLGIRDLEYHSDLFEDIIIDNNQASEMSTVYTNILSGTMEAYASIVSNNLNNFIHRLTVVTIILMVPTLVASFYGMNLDHLPFRSHPQAFYILIFISIFLGVFLIWFYRRNQ